MMEPKPTNNEEIDWQKLSAQVTKKIQLMGIDDHEVIAELQQETLLRVTRKSQSTDLVYPTAFACGVAQNVVFEYLRKIRSRPWRTQELQSDMVPTSGAHASVIAEIRVEKMMKRLPEILTLQEQRLLDLWDQLPPKQIADDLSVSLATVYRLKASVEQKARLVAREMESPE